MTSSVGAMDPNDMTLGLTGQSFSASIGSVTVADMQVGLTGQSATSEYVSFEPVETLL